jgi:hypothetical protein
MRVGFGLFALSPILLVLGCGGGGGPTLAPVSGHVLVDDKPVEGVHVTFAPIGKDGQPDFKQESYGMTDASGAFTLQSAKDHREGAVVGKNLVQFSLIDREAKPMERLAARFNTKSKQEIEVPAGGLKDQSFKVSRN